MALSSRSRRRCRATASAAATRAARAKGARLSSQLLQASARAVWLRYHWSNIAVWMVPRRFFVAYQAAMRRCLYFDTGPARRLFGMKEPSRTILRQPRPAICRMRSGRPTSGGSSSGCNGGLGGGCERAPLAYTRVMLRPPGFESALDRAATMPESRQVYLLFQTCGCRTALLELFCATSARGLRAEGMQRNRLCASASRAFTSQHAVSGRRGGGAALRRLSFALRGGAAAFRRWRRLAGRRLGQVSEVLSALEEPRRQQVVSLASWPWQQVLRLVSLANSRELAKSCSHELSPALATCTLTTLVIVLS